MLEVATRGGTMTRRRSTHARVLTGVVLVTTVAASAPLDPRVARACSPPIDSGVGGCVMTGCVPSPWPEDGAVDVPLGTELRVEWTCPVFLETSRVLAPSFRLRRVSDDTILALVATDSGRFRPPSGLDAHADYVLEDVDHASGCADPTAFVSVAAFHTGTEVDTVPPPTPAPCITATDCRYDSCWNSACCGNWWYHYRAVGWTGDTDDIYELDIDGATAVVRGTSARFGESTTGMFGYRPGGTTFAPGTIVVTAIDPSGNRSAPSAPLVVDRCPTGLDAGPFGGGGGGELTECGWAILYPDADRPDGGLGPDPLDAGTRSMDGASPAAPAAAGCSVGAASPTMSTHVIGPLLATALAWRRSSKRRARSA